MADHAVTIRRQRDEDEGRQQEILERQLNGVPKPRRSKNRTVLAYATWVDISLIAVSSLAAIIAGALNPLLTVIYGQFAGTFDGFSNGSISLAQAKSSISRFALFFVYLAIAQFVFTYITTVGFYYTGERITRSLRRSYLKSIIRQNMAFFDTMGAGEITSRLASDMTVVEEGLTGKLSLSLTAAATFGSAFLIAFVMYWKLALILSSTVVLMALTSTVGGARAVKYSKEFLSACNRGATLAEEAITSIRHVTAFGIQEQLANRYLPYLVRAEREGVKSRSFSGIVASAMNAVPYLSYALSFWMGSRFLVSRAMNVSEITTTTLAIVIGAWAVARVAPNTQAFISSIASASGILEATSRQSPLDPLDKEGIDADQLDGCVAFTKVGLVYPSRSHVTVLHDVNFTVPAHKTMAIVGASGSGKTSIIEVLMRFYEPTRGRILFDGQDIQSLNLASLRLQISLVGQEPTLFSASIFENIRYGLKRLSDQLSEAEVETRVVQASRTANAHDFISALPLGYQTQVGEKGLQLSGGQRQRIAIARAVVSNPKLLLLDEATSALDTNSERAVQRALEAASRGRTTIVIAHRLSTVRHADKIVVVSKGNVVEQGKHDDLIMKRGHYYHLVESQQFVENQPSLGPEGNEKSAEALDYISEPLASSENTSKVLDTSNEKKGDKPPTYPGVVETNPAEKQEPLSFVATSRFIAKLNRPEFHLVLLGLALSALAGLGTPGQSILFAKVIDALSQPPALYHALRNQVNFWALMYLVLGLGLLIVCIGKSVALAYTEEKFTSRAKIETLRCILRQDVPFFDQKHRSVGGLMSLLSSGTTDLGGAGGLVMGYIVSFCATIGGGVVLSLAIGWKLALVCASTIPLVAGCGYVRLMMLSIFDEKVKKTHSASVGYASEAISAIRTVASLCLEEQVLAHYNEMLAEQAAKSLRSILQTSVLYAASQSITFFCAGLAFWYGGRLITEREYSIFQFFICFASLISGAQTAGIVFSYAPGFSKAMTAAGQLKALFDRQPPIDTWDAAGKRIPQQSAGSHIELRNVSFRYPLRPDRLVLRDFSLSVRPGQLVALVGPSGCGKSTIIGLLERFFDPTEGHISVNGEHISQLNVNDYRRMISLVGQEPTLYSGTIKENVMLGAPAHVAEDDVIRACQEANIYDFIRSLPSGFTTDIGPRGTMLSGGQKQRLAIARALLRDTPILLLDEATSSLDAASEQLVQTALDAAARRRTTIAVAHRLSTIRHADRICVLERGRVVEAGTHAQLVARRGVYYSMCRAQNAERVDEGEGG